MAGRYARSRDVSAEFWPGFVDALATLVLVFMLLMTLFLLAKAFQDRVATTLDSSNRQLQSQIEELGAMLNMAQRETRSLEDEKAMLEATLADLRARESATARTAERVASGRSTLETQLAEERQLAAGARNEVTLLNSQLAKLRQQIASLQTALDAAEEADRENKATIADMGRRLNAALARKVQELTRYRSEFFSQLVDILGDEELVRVEGDRFVFQSEVLFDSGQASINADGRHQLRKLGRALRQLENDIPTNVAWILRVDGHTDIRPITSGRYESNWHLSTARALSVVEFLREQGVPARRLAAAGFGEYHPIDARKTAEAYRRNRRIELKLTDR